MTATQKELDEAHDEVGTRTAMQQVNTTLVTPTKDDTLKDRAL